MPEISIIVPVYNVEKYLCDCIDSILKQSFVDFELILVNDGSLDKSGLICEEYAKKDTRIRVIHQNNKGQAAARNYGIKVAKGQWVHFVDADDIIHPSMLEVLFNSLNNSNVRISMCGGEEAETVSHDFFEKENFEFNVYDVNENYLRNLYLNTQYRYWIVWGKLIDIDIVRKIPFSEGRVYEDNAVVCQWLYEAKKVADTSCELYFYRINTAGTTKSAFSIKRLDFLWALEEQLIFYDSINYKDMLNEIFRFYMANATHIYNTAKEQLNNTHINREIYIKTKHVYRRYKKQAKLEKNELIYLYGVFHSNIIKIYWSMVRIKSVYKETGIIGVCKKIVHKIFSKVL